MSSRSRLPGIYFQAEPQPVEDALPRMDIAAFVGFAESGPLHTPVPVEDIARFRDIFGDDFPLAWDEKTHRMQCANLAQAVEDFFLNGGRRCWIVRVADENTAKLNRFTLPGMVKVENNKFSPAVAYARSEGSWSDELRAGTMLISQPVRLVNFNYDNFNLDIDAKEQIQIGDLLQINTTKRDALLFLAVESVEPLKLSESTMVSRVTGNIHCFLYQPTDILPRIAKAVLLTPDKEVTLSQCSVLLPNDKSDLYEVELKLPLPQYPTPGSMLRIDYNKSLSLLLSVNDVEVLGNAEKEKTVVLRGKDGLWPVEYKAVAGQWKKKGLPAKSFFVKKISFDLSAWRGKELYRQISNLGFCKLHPRYWAKLPSDNSLFCRKQEKDVNLEPIFTEAADPRFPFAGNEDLKVKLNRTDLDIGFNTTVYLPIGMSVFSNNSVSCGSIALEGSSIDLECNGLGNFSAGLFLDKNLASIGSLQLLNEANYKYYLQGEQLRGLYSLLPLDEVTLVSIPDAVHRGWEYSKSMAPRSVAAPKLMPVKVTEKYAYTVSWTKVGGAETYILQVGTDPEFIRSTELIITKETEECIQVKGDCCIQYYFRVRSVYSGETSPWSNTERVSLSLPQFENCTPSYPNPPELKKVSVADGQWRIRWKAVKYTTGYTLQEAKDPEFVTSVNIYTGDKLEFNFRGRDKGIYYYRVRAESASGSGPWSNTQQFVSGLRLGWVTSNPEDYDYKELLAVHRALLRFCAARGDMLAVLSLPSHYQDNDVLTYVSELKSYSEDLNVITKNKDIKVLSFDRGEGRVLSFGALYHPWISSRREGTAGLRFSPPDGAICGIMAAQAISKGAWVSPANLPIKGALSLGSVINSPVKLFEAQVNTISQEPRGFIVLSSDTLSPNASLEPINVRRLLILLQRTVLREGNIYIFQPNNETFHRLVQNSFESLLSRLYVRGAFAGDTPKTAYQVVTDSSVNPKESLELGRFIVDIRVAPSRPMAFITIRLTQTGPTSMTVQEI